MRIIAIVDVSLADSYMRQLPNIEMTGIYFSRSGPAADLCLLTEALVKPCSHQHPRPVAACDRVPIPPQSMVNVENKWGKAGEDMGLILLFPSYGH